MVSLTNVLAAANTDRNSFNYWMGGGYLSTQYAPTRAGVARELSRENALEIVFMAILTKHGASPATAQRQTKTLMELNRNISSDFYFCFSADDLEGGQTFLKTQKLDSIATIFESPASGFEGDPDSHNPAVPIDAFVAINVAKIVKGIEALFEQTNTE